MDDEKKKELKDVNLYEKEKANNLNRWINLYKLLLP